MTDPGPENLAEALDEGVRADAVASHLRPGTVPSERSARDIARSIRDQQQLHQIAVALLDGSREAAVRILLAACGVGGDGRTTLRIVDPRAAADLLRTAAEGARWDLLHRLRLTAERLENGEIPGPDHDPDEQRQRRRDGRRLARLDDLHPLALHAHDDETTRAAAHVIHHEGRRADLLAHTYDPPEPLCRALAAHSHHAPHHPPADLRGHEPALIAARLHQASPLSGPSSPHGTRWLHARHPVLWLTGHDDRPPDEADLQDGATPEPNMRALTLVPSHWYRHAANASRRSRTSIADAAAHGLDPADQSTVRSLAASWTLGLEELRRTAHTINRH